LLVSASVPSPEPLEGRGAVLAGLDVVGRGAVEVGQRGGHPIRCAALRVVLLHDLAEATALALQLRDPLGVVDDDDGAVCARLVDLGLLRLQRVEFGRERLDRSPRLVRCAAFLRPGLGAAYAEVVLIRLLREPPLTRQHLHGRRSHPQARAHLAEFLARKERSLRAALECVGQRLAKGPHLLLVERRQPLLRRFHRSDDRGVQGPERCVPLLNQHRGELLGGLLARLRLGKPLPVSAAQLHDLGAHRVDRQAERRP